MKQRVITGVIAAALFLPILWIGGKLFLAVVYLLATIGLTELFLMRKMRIVSISGIITYLTMWVLMLPSEILMKFDFLTGFTRLELLYIGISLLLGCMVISKNKFNFDDAGFSALSLIYVGVSFSALYVTREHGLTLLLLVLFMIWGSDTGAYQFGVKFGKHKLWPTISPKKSIEGFFGGMLLSVVVALCFYFFSDISFSLIKFILLGVMIAVVGTFGDLVQSAFKRHYRVKDSGNILPGHGGILDRFDSILYTLPILLIFNII